MIAKKINVRFALGSTVIAVLWAYVSYKLEDRFFQFWKVAKFSRMYLLIHFLFIVFLALVIYFILSFFRQVFIDKSKRQLFRFSVFLPYFIIMAIIWLLTWPGIWRGDEFYILYDAYLFSLGVTQGFITYFLYIFSLMLIPIPAMVPFVWMTINSCIVAYIVVELYYAFDIPKNKLWICVSPFLLLPVIDSNLYPMRLSIYAFIVLMFVVLYAIDLKKKNVGNSLSPFGLVKYVILISILTVWRDESRFFLLTLTLSVCVLFAHTVKKKELMAFILATLMISISFVSYQNHLIHRSWGNKYTIMGTLHFFHEILNLENAEEKYGDHIDNIAKVIDAQMLKEEGYSSGFIEKEDSTEEDFNNYMKSFVYLVIKEPLLMVKSRMPIFLTANGLKPRHRSVFVQKTQELYEKAEDSESIQAYFVSRPMTQPLTSYRNKVVDVLECYNTQTGEPSKATMIFYNAIPGILIIAFLLVHSIIKRNWGFAVIYLSLCVRTVLVFLTAHDGFFMFYYPEYLTGYFMLVLFCLTKGFCFNKNCTESKKNHIPMSLSTFVCRRS